MTNVNWFEWNSKKNNFEKNQNIKSFKISGNYSSFDSDISIVILTYKRANTLKRALKSAVNQNYDKKYGIIILDDYAVGDYDTEQLVKKYVSKYDNISYFRNEKNLGQYAAWNRAVELSTTKWFCLLHDDDYLEPNYLETMDTTINQLDNNVGLVGSYFHTVDERKVAPESKPYRTLINSLVDIFIKLRSGKPIEIGLKENIDLIYVLSCCLLINKNFVIDVGGLDDQYYPSSDFALGSKMNCYYKTVFLPLYLSNRGIAENESLKVEVCEGSIKCAFYQTYEMMKYLNKSDEKAYKTACRSAVIAEIGVKGYRDIDYGSIKKELGIPKKYNNRLFIEIISIYSKYKWGILLLK